LRRRHSAPRFDLPALHLERRVKREGSFHAAMISRPTPRLLRDKARVATAQPQGVRRPLRVL
jgi:hypothetical protein